MVTGLVRFCVDALARALLSDGSGVDEADVAALVEQLELLPPRVSRLLAQRLQFHQLHTPADPDGAKLAGAQCALWTALVDRQWLTELRVAAVPPWLLGSQTRWSALPLQVLDCSRVGDRSSAQLSSFLYGSLSLHELRELNLSGQGEVVTDAVLETIVGQGCHLQVLDLSYCSQLSEPALEAFILKQQSLRRLSLNGLRQITRHQVVAAVENCTKLTVLELEDCVGLSRLPHLSTRLLRLTDLNLHGVTQFNDHQTCVALTVCFPRLRRLKLGESNLSGVSLSQILQLSPPSLLLTSVDLSWCQAIDSEAIASLIRSSPHLTELRLRCTAIKDPVLDAIGTVLLDLRLLDLERCDELTADGFQALAACAQKANSLQRLEKLNLSWTNVTSASLFDVLSRCSTTIKKVKLHGCKAISHSLIDSFVSSGFLWPNLRLVDCSWINDIADDQLRELAVQLPKVKVIGYYGTQLDHTRNTLID